MSHNILLEAGTNEMELLIFRLKDTLFGINVAKVREIIQRQKTISIPHSPESVVGSFTLREEVLTLVNLGHYFGMEGEESQGGEGLIVLVEFNNMRCGILVDAVEEIHRMKWDKIEPPSEYLMSLKAPVTGSAHIDDKTVLIADFETIIAEILGIEVATLTERKENIPVDRQNVRILFADDSATLRHAVTRNLQREGYENLTVCTDGQQAWDKLDASRGAESGAYDLVLSDIEMPRMDGLHLTSKIKNDADFQNIPVVLFSSLITKDNIRKGESVGADAQISKPDSIEMVVAIEKCLEKVGKEVTQKAEV